MLAGFGPFRKPRQQAGAAVFLLEARQSKPGKRLGGELGQVSGVDEPSLGDGRSLHEKSERGQRTGDGVPTLVEGGSLVETFHGHGSVGSLDLEEHPSFSEPTGGLATPPRGGRQFLRSCKVETK